MMYPKALDKIHQITMRYTVAIYRTTVMKEVIVDNVDNGVDAINKALDETKDIPYNDYMPADREKVCLVYSDKYKKDNK